MPDTAPLATASPDPTVLTPVTDKQRAQAQAFLDRAAAIHREHVVSGQLTLGKAALDLLYGGDFALFQDRAAAQHRPLDLLAEEFADDLERMGLTLEAIRRCIVAWRVDSQLPPHLRGQLAASHLARLSSVASPVDRVQMAETALQQGWSVKDTADAVADYRARNGQQGKGGPKPVPEPLRVMRRLGRELEALDATSLEGLTADQLAEVQGLAQRLIEAASRLG